jgi:pimeloyl-ACP methyl ester carboxylesterase
MVLGAGISSRARIGDLKIAYESSGTGDPALVFVHGLAADRSYFAAQLAHFRGRRRLVSLDLRGHGESSTPAQVTIDDFAADVIAVADAAGLESAVFCGHSMAGVVGLKVALARPSLVRGVAMIEGTVLFPDQVRQAGLTGLVPALAGERWFEALSGYLSSRILDPQDREELRQRVMADARRTRPDFARTFFASLFSSDYAIELGSASCPLLYIHAKTPTDLQRLRELRPDAMVGQVVGSGHYPMLTVPDQVNAMLDRFLDVVEHQRA